MHRIVPLSLSVIFLSGACSSALEAGPQPLLKRVDAPAVAPSDRCETVKASVRDAGFSDKVTVTCDAQNALLTSDTYPDHEMMTGIVGTNEQVPVPAKNYSAPVRLSPVISGQPKTRDAALATAVNGVPIYDYTGGGEMSVQELYHHQTRHDTLLTHQLDNCGGHAGRGDDYHYHVSPKCMIDAMPNAGDAAILGWAFDGFPIYGNNNPDGSAIAADKLDVCNGQADEKFGYRYHTSERAPYIIQCLMGEADAMRALPKVRGLEAANGGGRATSGRPPNGGVENLIFQEDASGARSMDYTYKGQSYYIRYTPSETPNCYDFERRTVTNGKTERGEYCR